MPVPRSMLENIPGKGPLVAESRACAGCGYDLKGLFIGGNCPECGRRIGVQSTRATSHLMEAPRGWLLGLAGGCTLLTMSLVGGGLLVGAQTAGVFTAISRQAIQAGLLGLAVMWVAGVIVLLRERPEQLKRKDGAREGPEWPRLRLAVLLTTLPIVPLVVFDTIALTGGKAWAQWLAVGCAAIVGLGAIPLSYWLGVVASWACDDALSTRFRNIGFFLAAGALGTAISAALLLSGHPALMVLGAFAWVFWGLVVVSLLMLALSVAQMNWAIVWLLRNRQEALERAERMAEREARYAAQRAEADARMGIDPSPFFAAAPDLLERTPSAPAAPPTVPITFGNERVIAPTKGEPLKLEGE